MNATLFMAAFAMGKCQLGYGEVKVMTLLRDHGPSEVNVLATRLKTPNMVTTSTSLNVARKHGFVEWSSDAEDQRKKIYHITDSGLLALKDAEEEFARNMRLAVKMLGK